MIVSWVYRAATRKRERTWNGTVLRGYRDDHLVISFPPGLPDYCPAEGGHLRWPEADARDRILLTRLVFRTPPTPAATPNATPRRPPKRARSTTPTRYQPKERVPSESDDDPLALPQKRPRERITARHQKAPTATRQQPRPRPESDSESDTRSPPPHHAGTTAHLLRVLEQDSEEDVGEDLYARLRTSQNRMVAADGVAYPLAPDIKWVYAYLWAGKEPSLWQQELHQHVRLETAIHGCEVSKTGMLIITQMEQTFVHWIGSPTPSIAVGQSILESILLQLVLARFGPEGPAEMFELVREARSRGALAYSRLLTKIKARPTPKYKGNYTTDFRRHKENEQGGNYTNTKWKDKGKTGGRPWKK